MTLLECVLFPTFWLCFFTFWKGLCIPSVLLPQILKEYKEVHLGFACAILLFICFLCVRIRLWNILASSKRSSSLLCWLVLVRLIRKVHAPTKLTPDLQQQQQQQRDALVLYFHLDMPFPFSTHNPPISSSSSSSSLQNCTVQNGGKMPTCWPTRHEDAREQGKSWQIVWRATPFCCCKEERRGKRSAANVGMRWEWDGFVFLLPVHD